MGGSRVLPRGLIALAALLAACGGGDEDLLDPADLSSVYAGGGGGTRYGPKGTGTGTISGRVLFRGRPWKRDALDLATVDGIGANHNEPGGRMSESFLLGADGALQNVVVYLKKGVAHRKWKVPAEPVVLNQRDCQYSPHVAVLQTGQTLIVKNSDDTGHNVHMARGPNGELNRSMTRPGQLEPLRFKKPEVARRIYCDAHEWMEAWLAILPHPFHAVTGAAGTFTIEEVPAGTYLLAAWHEQRALAEQTVDVVVKPGETTTVAFTFERK